MKVKFLKHFGGRETKERHYEPGEVARLDDELAEKLISRGIVVKLEKEAIKIVEPKNFIEPALKTKAGKK
jgi:hypothetical protein